MYDASDSHGTRLAPAPGVPALAAKRQRFTKRTAECPKPACEEEPELIRLQAEHYRAMLSLTRLTDCQRGYLHRLLGNCEAQLTQGTPSEWHQHAECLTAIRLYAAGARRALRSRDYEAAVWALAKVDAEVSRAKWLPS